VPCGEKDLALPVLLEDRVAVAWDSFYTPIIPFLYNTGCILFFCVSVLPSRLDKSQIQRGICVILFQVTVLHSPLWYIVTRMDCNYVEQNSSWYDLRFSRRWLWRWLSSGM
jgi:hypothetical protein